MVRHVSWIETRSTVDHRRQYTYMVPNHYVITLLRLTLPHLQQHFCYDSLLPSLLRKKIRKTVITWHVCGSQEKTDKSFYTCAFQYHHKIRQATYVSRFNRFTYRLKLFQKWAKWILWTSCWGKKTHLCHKPFLSLFFFQYYPFHSQRLLIFNELSNHWDVCRQ